MKILLLLGRDAAASNLGFELEQLNIQNLRIYVDKSKMLRKIIRILIKGRIRIPTLLKITWAEFLRKKKKFNINGTIQNNAQLLKVIREDKPDIILCFRCGLIINQSVLNENVAVYNIHVSDLPHFPGLGTIDQSIKARSWDQNACLHYIDVDIDQGQVLYKKKYTMNVKNSYKNNEDIAYRAGIALAIEFIRNQGKLCEI